MGQASPWYQTLVAYDTLRSAQEASHISCASYVEEKSNMLLSIACLEVRY